MREEDIQKYIDRYIYDGRSGGFIYNDISKSLELGLNFLTALGLMTYTEFLGSLLPALSSRSVYKGKEGRNRRNFYNCFYRMGSDYKAFDLHLWTNFKKGVYEIYRGGLVHAYFIGGNLRIGKVRVYLSSVVAKTSNRSLGIADGFKLAIGNKNYFKDLIKVIRLLRNKVLEKKDKEWVKAFLEGSGLETHILE